MSFPRKLTGNVIVTALPHDRARITIKMPTGEQIEIDLDPAKLDKLVADLSAARAHRESANV